MKLSTQLKKYRQANGFTQEELANYLHISRQSISKWERGQSYPDLDNLLILSKLYNVSINCLIEDGGDPTATNSINSEDQFAKNKKTSRKKTSANIGFHHILLSISILSVFLPPIGGAVAVISILLQKKELPLYRANLYIACLSVLISLSSIVLFLL